MYVNFVLWFLQGSIIGLFLYKYDGCGMFVGFCNLFVDLGLFMLFIFYLVYYVCDFDQLCYFYCDLLGCVEGCSIEIWVDIDFFGY